jgi:hypothetical protein
MTTARLTEHICLGLQDQTLHDWGCEWSPKKPLSSLLPSICEQADLEPRRAGNYYERYMFPTIAAG